MIHKLSLATEPFEMIRNGKKVIESRLFDEKRQAIQLGDGVEFENREKPSEIIRVKVIGLLQYETFHDLFTHNSPSKFGGESVKWLENQINELYSPQQQSQYSVIGIEFEVL